MPIFRIYLPSSNAAVGCIVASNSEVAGAYALGKYGAGSSVAKVSSKDALSVTGVCVLVETKEVSVRHGIEREHTYRVIE